MKKMRFRIKLKYLIAIIVLSMSGIIISCVTISKDKEQVILGLTYELLKLYHYEKVDFNDEFSTKVFDKYIEMIDYSKRFLLDADVKKLQKKSANLSQQIKSSDVTFFVESYQIITERTKDAQAIFEEIISKPIDINKDETINLDPKKRKFASNKKELYKYWANLIKMEVLQQMNSEELDIEQKIKKGDTSVVKKSNDELEADAIEEVKKNYTDFFNRMEQLNEEDYFSFFINSITQSVDPHTEYFAPKQKEDFEIYTSGELEGIGATLSQRFGKIKVVSLVVGGPAWKEGELEEGDFIVKVAQEGEPSVNVENMRLDDAVRLIRGKKGTKVKLTVEKIDGSIKDIVIERDKVEIEESFARTLILEDTLTGKKIAYIYLPGFYSNFNDPKNGRQCSTDILKELKKIKAEPNVDGIVIDLRNNGGGSLFEVVKMAGFFIGQGPIVQVKDRNGKIQVLKDKNPRIEYKGNLLVMTNQFSASASEIFAAAMQDYNRAIIFGTQQTLGKGTVQQVLSLDQLPIYTKYKPLGALKLTIQKFYRINGGSTQLKGVLSDIPYISAYSFLKTGEASMDNALPWDKIPKANYKLWTPPYNKDSVIIRSKKRIQLDSSFIYEEEFAHYLKKTSDENQIPLNFDKFREYQKQSKEKRDFYNRKINTKISLKVDFLETDKKLMGQDTILKFRFINLMKRVKKDYHLQEAFNIVEDMKNS